MIKSFSNCKMAGMNLESAPKKSAGTRWSRQVPIKQNRRELKAATIRWLSSAIERK
jgi:hypothetical protein